MHPSKNPAAAWWAKRSRKSNEKPVKDAFKGIRREN